MVVCHAWLHPMALPLEQNEATGSEGRDPQVRLSAVGKRPGHTDLYREAAGVKCKYTVCTGS